MLPKIFLVFILLCGPALPLHAQSQVYERFYLDAGTSFSIAKNDFTALWRPTPALDMAARVSFYAGNIEAGLRLSRFDYTGAGQSGTHFYSTFLYLGWEHPLTISRRLQITPGIRFGNNFMLFNQPKIYSEPASGYDYVFDTEESEVAYELFTRLDYSFSRSPWTIHTSLSYNRTLTYHPLPVLFASLGCSYALSTPDWLKDFLK